MAKLTLNNITSGYSSNTAYNTNNDLIEAALENTLSRDGTTPNTMGADIDMNGYRVLNELAQSGDGFIWQGAWVTGTDYALNMLVSNEGSSYISKVAHTAGAVFATDLAAAKWEVLATKGDTGAGTGDMLISNNLSELTATAATARGNISAAALAGSASQAFAAADLTAYGTILSTGGLEGIGYSGGGAVTQLTSKATGVTMAKTCGQITTHNASLAAAAVVSFTVTTTGLTIDAGDMVIASITGGGTTSNYHIWGWHDGSANVAEYKIFLKNISAGALTDALLINVMIFQGRRG